MFNYDTHQARTDLYGIGKGEAQVLDPSHIFAQQEAEKERDFRREQAKTKAEEDRMDNINKSVVPIKGVLPKERDYFVNGTKELSEYAIKNAKGLSSGDPSVVMGFYDKYYDLLQKAYTSSETYKQAQQRDAEIQRKGKEKYRTGDYEGSLDAWEKWKETFDPENIGGADYTKFLPQEHSPLTDKVIHTIMPTVQNIGKRNEMNGMQKMNYEDSKGVLFQNIHNNAKDFDEALYEYKTATPEQISSIEQIYAKQFPDKAKPIENVSDYIEQVGMPYLPFENQNLDKWQVYGGGNEKDKKINLTYLYDDEGNVRGANMQTKGGLDNKEFATVKINGVPTKVRVEETRGDKVYVSIPQNKEKVEKYYEDAKKWKNEELKMKQELMKLNEELEMKQELMGLSGNPDKAPLDKIKTAWYKANKFPEFPKEYTQQAILSGDDAESALHQAYGITLEQINSEKLPNFVNIDVSMKGKKEVPLQKSGNKTYTPQQEAAIKRGMEDNPGVSRERIIKALGL